MIDGAGKDLLKKFFLFSWMMVSPFMLLGRLGPFGSTILVKSEYIFESAPFAQCHASTIAESRGCLIAAWFAGTREGQPDVGIWTARFEGGRWGMPVEVADGIESPSLRYPCWNPVLFQPKTGPLMLFYKVGPSPSAWWGVIKTSDDGGRTWSAARRLPQGILGPVKNKPVQMADGSLLCPSSRETDGWRVHFERTDDLGRTWQTTPPVNDGREFGAIQPSLLIHAGGLIQALGRTRQGVIFQIWSGDGGRTWGPMTSTGLPNPNSGIDAVTLADGRHLLVYNDSKSGRSPLNVAVSSDGRTWRSELVLESGPGEFSYPAVIQTNDGLVHVTYTWKRLRVKHVILDPKKLGRKDAVNPQERREPHA